MPPFVPVATAPVDPLEKQAREIEKRRARLEERRIRILDAKTRLIGVDTDALAKQIEGKQKAAQDEKDRTKQYDNDTQLHSTIITAHVSVSMANQKVDREQLSIYQQKQALEKTKRDKLLKYEEKSASVSTELEDTIFLKFAGEDLNAKARATAQAAQQADWIGAQINSLELREEKESNENKIYDATQKAILDIQNANEAERIRQVKQRTADTSAFNIQMRNEQIMKQKNDARIDQQMKDAELTKMYNSAFLREDNNFDGNRSCYFKGFDTNTRQAVLDGQQRQQQEIQAQREFETATEKKWAEQSEAQRRMLVRLNAEKQRTDAQQRQGIRDIRLRQVREKQANDKYLNEVVYPNHVSEEFFEQFGTSAR